MGCKVKNDQPGHAGAPLVASEDVSMNIFFIFVNLSVAVRLASRLLKALLKAHVIHA